VVDPVQDSVSPVESSRVIRSGAPSAAVNAPHYAPRQVPHPRLSLQRRAPSTLRRHLARAVGRFAVLLTADLTAFAILRELYRSVGEGALLGTWVSDTVQQLLRPVTWRAGNMPSPSSSASSPLGITAPATGGATPPACSGAARSLPRSRFGRRSGTEASASSAVQYWSRRLLSGSASSPSASASTPWTLASSTARRPPRHDLDRHGAGMRRSRKPACFAPRGDHIVFGFVDTAATPTPVPSAAWVTCPPSSRSRLSRPS